MIKSRCFSFFVLFLVVATFAGFTDLFSQGSEGYWDLTETKKIDRSKRGAEWVGNTMNISNGNITFSTSCFVVSPNTYYERIGTWMPPPGVLIPGKTLSLTLKMRNGKVKTTFFENGQISAALPGGYLYDSKGESNILLPHDRGEGAEISKVFSATVPGRIDPGKMELTVFVNSGSDAGGEFRYIYTWRKGTPPSPTPPPPTPPPPTPSPPTPPSPSLPVTIEPNTDRYGLDYKKLSGVASADDCRAACAKDADCDAYSYVKSSRDCYLKKGVPAATPNSNVVSGVKVRSGKPEPPKKGPSIEGTSWIVNRHPVPWVFHRGGVVEATGLWKGRWTSTGEGIEVTLTHQGVTDRFIVKLSADGRTFTAYKGGQVYRTGERSK